MIRYFSDLILADNVDEFNMSIQQMSEYLIILYCEQGSLQVDINGRQHLLGPQNVLLCVPQTLIGHYMRTPDFKARALAVGKHLFDNVLNDCFEMEPNWWQKANYLHDNPIVSPDEYRIRLIESSCQLANVYAEDAQTPYRNRIIRTMAQAAAFEILAVLEEKILLPDNNVLEINGPKDHILHDFMKLLNRPGNYEREVQYYAEKLLVSPKHLSAVCKEKTTKSASELINQVMAGHIHHFLTQSNLSIKEIAFQIGFSDVSFFCRYTRKHLGLTPFEYRRQHIQSKSD